MTRFARKALAIARQPLNHNRGWELRGNVCVGYFLPRSGRFRGIIEFTAKGLDIWVLRLSTTIARHCQDIQYVGNSTHQIEIPESIQRHPLAAVILHCEDVIDRCFEHHNMTPSRDHLNDLSSTRGNM